MAQDAAGDGIDGRGGGLEEVLPGPVGAGARVLARECGGEVDGAGALGEVAVVTRAMQVEVVDQGFLEARRQDGDSVFLALAIADDDLLEIEVEVFDAQAQALGEAHAGAVEELEEEAVVAWNGFEDATHLVLGEDERMAAAALDADERTEGAEVATQDLAVEEEQGREGLGLGGCGDVAMRGEVGEEAVDVALAELAWIGAAEEAEVALRPHDVGVLGPLAEMADADDAAQVVEQAAKRLGGEELGVVAGGLLANDRGGGGVMVAMAWLEGPHHRLETESGRETLQLQARSALLGVRDRHRVGRCCAPHSRERVRARPGCVGVCPLS